MSYVWTHDQVERYFGYYPGITARNSYAYLTYRTSPEFVRDVLPPCLEVCDVPTVTFAGMAFVESVAGVTNRHGRDRAASITVNAKLGDREGTYYLSVIEEGEVNIETGRELWGMPKKFGSVDVFDDGRTLWTMAERKGYRLFEFEAELGPELGPQEPSVESYFELRGYFGPNGVGLSGVQLLSFELPAKTHRYRELSNPHIHLVGSPIDPGVETIPVGDFVEGGLTGGETSYSIGEVVELDGDGHDYRPYLLGRLYDDWPDFRDSRGRRGDSSPGR